jgi:hypothetical protein
MSTPPARGTVALAWGVAGFTALLLVAVVRLAPIALDAFSYPWQAMHYAAFTANLWFMAWYEGYRGFQRSYSPRLAARAHHLYRHATRAQTALAPLVCMGFVHAPRRRRIAAWLLTAAIIVVVMIYRALPQPWRGILDAGVVVGLLWGMAATLYEVYRQFHRGSAVDAEMR